MFGMADTPISSSTPPITLQDVMERVERLLLRHHELQRTNALLQTELASANAERESLRSRLSAARSRVDALIERLPAPAVGSGSGRPVVESN